MELWGWCFECCCQLTARVQGDLDGTRCGARQRIKGRVHAVREEYYTGGGVQ